MILERAEAPGESDVLGASDVLVAEEQHLVLEQQRPDLGEQGVVARGVAEVDVRMSSAPMAQVRGSTLIEDFSPGLGVTAGAEVPGATVSWVMVVASPLQGVTPSGG